MIDLYISIFLRHAAASPQLQSYGIYDIPLVFVLLICLNSLGSKKLSGPSMSATFASHLNVLLQTNLSLCYVSAQIKKYENLLGPIVCQHDNNQKNYERDTTRSRCASPSQYYFPRWSFEASHIVSGMRGGMRESAHFGNSAQCGSRRP